MNKPEIKVNKCGCKIERDRYGVLFLEYCPKHKAAGDMYEALKMIEPILDTRPNPTGGNTLWTIAKQAIAKAEGK